MFYPCQERVRSIPAQVVATIVVLFWLSVSPRGEANEIVVYMADNVTYSPGVNVFGSAIQHFHYGNGFWDQSEQIRGNGLETDTKYGDGNTVDGVADAWYFLNPDAVLEHSLEEDLTGDHGHYQMITCVSDAPVYFACKSYYVNDESSPNRYKASAELLGSTEYRISVACKGKNDAEGTFRLWLRGPTGLAEYSSSLDVEQDWTRLEWFFEPSNTISRQVVVEIAPAQGSEEYEFCIDEAELLPSEFATHGTEDQDIAEHIETFGINGVPVLRFPGGTDSQGYVWTDGIGSMLKRPLAYARLNAAYDDSENYPVYLYEAIPGTDEFLSYCEEKEIAPLLVVNHLLWGYGDILEELECRPAEGPWDSTAVIDLAANWVEYCNSVADGGLSNPRGGIDWAEIRAANGRSAPYNVQLWQVGNEEWAFEEPEDPFSFTASQYAAHFVKIARAMKQVDNTIKIAATGYHPYFEWNDDVLAGAALQRVGHGGPFLMDFLAYHRYSPQDTTPSGEWTEDECRTVMADVLNFREELAQVQDAIDEYTDMNTGLSIALTEHATAMWGGGLNAG